MHLSLKVEQVFDAAVVGVVGVGVGVGEADRPAAVDVLRNAFGDLPVAAQVLVAEVPLQRRGGEIHLGIGELRGNEPGLQFEIDHAPELILVDPFPGQLDKIEGRFELGLGKLRPADAEQGQGLAAAAAPERIRAIVSSRGGVISGLPRLMHVSRSTKIYGISGGGR